MEKERFLHCLKHMKYIVGTRERRINDLADLGVEINFSDDPFEQMLDLLVETVSPTMDDGDLVYWYLRDGKPTAEEVYEKIYGKET